MEILGVPLRDFSAALALSIILSSIIFWPALSSFGNAMVGVEDIRLILWIFWHIDGSLADGGNPFHAGEIFHPYGISLSHTPLMPFQSLLYQLAPDSWGAFGKVTALQLLSYALGGAFSFALAYRFTKSFMPSLAGMVIFNFSIFHFEKAIHHLNYSMAFPFLALAFLFYFDFMENPKKRRGALLWFSASLLLLALNEITVAVMAGFIIFLDILARYMERSKKRVFTPGNTLLFASGLISSVFLHELLAALSAPPALIYTAPSAPFLLSCLFALGPGNAVRSESSQGLIRAMLLSSLPILAYIALLALMPSYPFQPEFLFSSLFMYGVPASYLIIPSDFQQISHTGLFQGLAAYSEMGLYLGLPLIAMILLSRFHGKAAPDESRMRDFGILCMLFSFPIIALPLLPQFMSPFLVTPAFPLLSVLRVPSRFMLFSLLFLSLMAAMLIRRLIGAGGMKANTLAALLILILLAERCPASGAFMFDSSVPAFFSGLAHEAGDCALFIYPDISYFPGLNEMYYQTIHGRDMSFGIVSRQPSGGNALYSLYSHPAHSIASINETLAKSAQAERDFGYGYVIVEKMGCLDECLYGTQKPMPENYSAALSNGLSALYGSPVYEDDSIAAYKVSGASCD